MRLLLFSTCFLLLVSCQNENSKTKKPTFLIGNWIRKNDKKGNKTYENWQKDLTGLGFTLKNKDTIFKELMSIVSLNDTLHLKVEGVNEKPTLFKFTKQTDTSFVCENPQNEFPKNIYYFKDGKQLKAIVSADDFKIDFIFEKN